ncbi:hypothetical protein KIPB_009271, partial [Kipferlia bialata]
SHSDAEASSEEGEDVCTQRCSVCRCGIQPSEARLLCSVSISNLSLVGTHGALTQDEGRPPCQRTKLPMATRLGTDGDYSADCREDAALCISAYARRKALTMYSAGSLAEALTELSDQGVGSEVDSQQPLALRSGPVATACPHVVHERCIGSMLEGRRHPDLQCPVCRGDWVYNLSTQPTQEDAALLSLVLTATYDGMAIPVGSRAHTKMLEKVQTVCSRAGFTVGGVVVIAETLRATLLSLDVECNAVHHIGTVEEGEREGERDSLYLRKARDALPTLVALVKNGRALYAARGLPAAEEDAAQLCMALMMAGEGSADLVLTCLCLYSMIPDRDVCVKNPLTSASSCAALADAMGRAWGTHGQGSVDMPYVLSVLGLCLTAVDTGVADMALYADAVTLSSLKPCVAMGEAEGEREREREGQEVEGCGGSDSIVRQVFQGLSHPLTLGRPRSIFAPLPPTNFDLHSLCTEYAGLHSVTWRPSSTMQVVRCMHCGCSVDMDFQVGDATADFFRRQIRNNPLARCLAALSFHSRQCVGVPIAGLVMPRGDCIVVSGTRRCLVGLPLYADKYGDSHGSEGARMPLIHLQADRVHALQDAMLKVGGAIRNPPAPGCVTKFETILMSV